MADCSKNEARLRRARRGRAKMRSLNMPRLSVFCSGRHIYAQVFSAALDRVIASASTIEKASKKSKDKSSKNAASAAEIGKLVAERSIKAGIDTVAFDRSGYKYHGKIKALADNARASGLKF